MKNIFLSLLTILVSSCEVSNLLSINSIYSTSKQNIETFLSDEPISGISDTKDNIHIISSNGKIIKISKANNKVNLYKNDYNFVSFGLPSNTFFNFDSKGNGFLIPKVELFDEIFTDPLTNISTPSFPGNFIVYKFQNLSVVKKYNVTIKGNRFKTFCISEDNCSDMYINTGGKNYLISKYIENEIIENDDISLDIRGEKESFNSKGNGFYLKKTRSEYVVYSFINGIVNNTNISVTDLNKINFKIDDFGNGHLIYNKNENDFYSKITNYNIQTPQQLKYSVDKKIYNQDQRDNNQSYCIINESGTGFIIYIQDFKYYFSKIQNFTIQPSREFIVNSLTVNMSDNNLLKVNSNGEGYLIFNYYAGSTNTKILNKIFLVSNFNLIK